jgi:HPt (histidine-containing phosphotransfer) domain-containing protein
MTESTQELERHSLREREEGGVEEPVDRAALLERLGDDVELLQDLVTMFLEDYPRSVEEIETAVRAQDPAQLRRSAHFLVGTLSNFSAREAQAAAHALELRGNTADLADAEADLRALGRALARLEPVLRRLVADGPAPAQDPPVSPSSRLAEAPRVAPTQ